MKSVYILGRNISSNNKPYDYTHKKEIRKKSVMYKEKKRFNNTDSKYVDTTGFINAMPGIDQI